MDKEKQTRDAPEQSLYRIICGAIGDDGMLHSAFSLPRPRRIQEKITFADGAYDGISLYHMTPDRRDIRSLTEIVGLLSAGACEKADECLTLFFFHRRIYYPAAHDRRAAAVDRGASRADQRRGIV